MRTRPVTFALALLEDFGYPDLFKRIHPDKPMADVGRRTTEARDMVRVEIWDLIDQVK
jgi:hypothetical protein